MIFAKLSILSGLAAVAIADTTINVDNLPVGCKDVCSQVSGISNGCKTNSNDASAATKCVCSANNASNLIPLCSACIGNFKSDQVKDNDSAVSSIMSQCSLKATAYNAAAISAVATSTDTVSTTKTAVVSKTSVAIIITSTSTQGASATSNPAPAKTAGAAIGIGALGLALGML